LRTPDRSSPAYGASSGRASNWFCAEIAVENRQTAANECDTGYLPPTSFGRAAEPPYNSLVRKASRVLVLALDEEFVQTRSDPSRLAWIFLAAALGVLCVLAGRAASHKGVASSHGDAAVPACLANLKGIYSGITMYAADHDDRLPPEDNWMDSLATHVPAGLFNCPAASTGTFGYAFRIGMGAKPLGSISEPFTHVLVFDSLNEVRNALADLTALPTPDRHRGGNYMLLATGTVVLH